MKTRSLWRRLLGLAACPLILLPLFVYTSVVDTMDWPKPVATILIDQLERLAPVVYGLLAATSLVVVVIGRWSKWLRTAWAVIGLSFLTLFAGCMLMAGVAGEGNDPAVVLWSATAVALASIPVAASYCLIAGVRWRVLS